MPDTVKVQCPACKATRVLSMEKYVLGDVLNPFPGGGDYGRCLKCKRTGLVVVEVPKPIPEKPVGWRSVPEK